MSEDKKKTTKATPKKTVAESQDTSKQPAKTTANRKAEKGKIEAAKARKVEEKTKAAKETKEKTKTETKKKTVAKKAKKEAVQSEDIETVAKTNETESEENAFAKQLKEADVKQYDETIQQEKIGEKEDLEKAKVYTANIDGKGRSYGTGKRKSSIARVWIKPGNGKIVVNKKESSDYFKRAVLEKVINKPFDITHNKGKFDVFATLRGGGLSGQADALKHGISKALHEYNPSGFRDLLKQAGLLTRDTRRVERKKYGHHKARKSHQFCKR